MVDIKKSKADISENEVENLEALYKTRDKLEKAELEAIKKKDGKLLNSVKQQMKSTKEYIKNLEKQIRIQTEVNRVLKAGIKPSDDLMKSLQKNTQAVENDNKARKESLKKSYEEIEASKTRQDQYEAEALQNFKKYTVTGKVLDSVGAKVSELAEKYTFSALAVQAFNRHVKATELRQNILIKTSKDLNDEIGKGFGDAARDISKYDEALAKAEAHAKYLGMSVDEVAGTMERFSYITGVKNPKTLATLTEGANSLAKSLGITTSEAIDFVSIRMEKFGGSAAGAIVTMDQLQKETTDINTAFGRTAVRGGDLVKSLMDISRQSNIYAIDQRFVGNILRENITRLQSMGDSYETANKKSMAFTKAVTGEAPEWMKVFAGQDLLGQLTKSFNAGKFEKEFGAELEAAKPGLMQQVADVLGDTSMGYYSKLRLVEEMMRGTTVGVEAMNKQILELANHPQGVEILSQQLHITRVEAQAVVEQAKSMQEKTILLTKLTKAKTLEEMASVAIQNKRLKITKEELATVIKGVKPGDEAGKKEKLAQFLSEKEIKASVAVEAKRKKVEKENMQKRVKTIKEEIQNLEVWKKEAEAGGKQDEAEIFESRLKTAKAELTRTEAKETDKEDETEGLKTVEDINREHLKKFSAYSAHTGNYIKSLLVGLGTMNNLLLAATAMGFGSIYLKKGIEAMFSGLMKHLASIVMSVKVVEGKDIATKEGEKYGGKEEAPKGKEAPKGRIRKIASDIHSGKFDESVRNHALALSIGAGAASSAMDRLTAKFDENGKEIETANSLAAKSLKSFSGGVSIAGGVLAQMPGKLGRLGGSIGAVTAAWEIGCTVGQGLNAVFDKLGWTGEETISALDKFSQASDSWAAKFLRWIGGTEDSKQQMDKSKQDLYKKLSTRYSKSVEEIAKIDKEAEKSGTSLVMYLKKQEGGGNLRQVAERQGVTKEDAERYISQKAKDREKYQRKTPISGTPISAESAAGLKLQRKEEEQGARRIEERNAVSDATKNTTAQVASMQQQQQQTTGTGTGSFVSVNPDGSSTLRAEITINNHMAAVAQANTMIKQNSIRGPLG